MTWQTCDSLLQRYARSGRNGVAVLREVINRRDPAQTPTESPMETAVLQVLREFGFPQPTTQYPIYDSGGTFIARADVAYPLARVAVEYQSAAHHSTESERVRDNRRRNRLRAACWEVIEARQDVGDDPVPFLSALRAALDSGLKAARSSLGAESPGLAS